MTETVAVSRPDSWKVDKSVNLSTMFQVLVLAGTILFAWASFDKRTSILEIQVQEQSRTMQSINSQTNRIERYLMSQDKQYWRKTYSETER